MQSILRVEVDAEKCIMCKYCVMYCPTFVFTIVNNKVTTDSSKCIECYGCVALCPTNAIRIEYSSPS
ncbi:MAG: DUF362 domain-containing protein [Desulfurococcaceae archaeon]